jgi:hypothetical protein
MGDLGVRVIVVAVVVDKSLINDDDDDDDVLLFSSVIVFFCPLAGVDDGVVNLVSSFVTVSTVVPDNETKLDW